LKTILLTGGAGFIGSHTAITLIELGYRVIIFDSFENSYPRVLEKIKYFFERKSIDIQKRLIFFKGDIRNKNLLSLIFINAIKDNYRIDAVIHLAGLKSVSESFILRKKYFDFNVNGARNLFCVMKEFDCTKIVFSSSASVYDASLESVFSEESPIKPSSPYGENKISIEKMLYENYLNEDGYKWGIINLRYFNPVGAHPSGLIGEDPLGKPNNLFPYITQVAINRKKILNIFGNDWPTKDGTAIRDYIHIMDIAKAHSQALKHIFENEKIYLSLNIGSGIGTTVLDLVKLLEKVNKCYIPYRIKPRRMGDVPKLIAECSKAKNILGWHPQYTLNDICKDAWNWILQNPQGYSE